MTEAQAYTIGLHSRYLIWLGEDQENDKEHFLKDRAPELSLKRQDAI